MVELTVRDACEEDMPAIYKLRDEYYARRSEPIQTREQVSWVIAESAGRLVAAQSTHDTCATERWQMDLYAEKTRVGRLGIAAIMNREHDRADLDGVSLIGIVTLDNKNILEAASARGWKCAGLMLYRPAGG